MTFQHHNKCSDSRAIEDVGRKAYDSIDIIVIDKVLSDVIVITWTEQDAMRKNDGHNTIIVYMA